LNVGQRGQEGAGQIRASRPGRTQPRGSTGFHRPTGGPLVRPL